MINLDAMHINDSVCDFVDPQAQQGDKLIEMFEALNASILSELGKQVKDYSPIYWLIYL